MVSAGLNHAVAVSWQVNWLVLDGFTYIVGNWLGLLARACGSSSRLPQAFLYSIWFLRGQGQKLDILLGYSTKCWPKQVTRPARIKGKGNSLLLFMGGIAKSHWKKAQNKDERNCCGYLCKQSSTLIYKYWNFFFL